jgi:hypothetical protein
MEGNQRKVPVNKLVGEMAEWFNAHAWKMEKHLLSNFGLIEISVELRGFCSILKTCPLGLV